MKPVPGDAEPPHGLDSIPGEFAGASLKRRVLHYDPETGVFHPRRIRRGLIEAG